MTAVLICVKFNVLAQFQVSTPTLLLFRTGGGTKQRYAENGGFWEARTTRRKG